MKCDLCETRRKSLRDNMFGGVGPRYLKNGVWWHGVFIMTNTSEAQECQFQGESPTFSS